MGDRALSCAKCDAPMVRRVAKRGKKAGNEFWGCSTFPACRSIVPIKHAGEDNSAEAVQDDACPFSSKPPDPPKGLLKRAATAVDGIWRWNLELDEPDARDRWKPGHRRKVLDYLQTRDGRRCGVCRGTMKLKGADVEHVVPKTVRGIRTQCSRQSPARHLLHQRPARDGEPPSSSPQVQQAQRQLAGHPQVAAPQHALSRGSQGN